MPDSSRPRHLIADEIAGSAIAEVGWWAALRWAAGLLSTARSWADLRDAGLIVAAVVLA